MTDPLRVLFREGRLPRPKGFYRILEARIPADITVGNRVVIKPNSKEKPTVISQHELTPDASSALKHLVAQSYSFSLTPTVDVFERLVTPGAGVVIGKILDEANIQDQTRRKLSQRALEDWIIPAHEVQGHIEPNLNPDKCFWEAQLIWLFLIECVQSPTLGRFQDWCDQWDDDIMQQSCIVAPAHEAYALIRDEQAWKQLEGQTGESHETLSRLRRYVRTRQNPTAVKILHLLSEKSGGDMRTVNRIIDEAYLESNANWSYILPHMVRDLNRGVEIDRIPEHVRDQTNKKWKGRYSPEEIERMMEEQQYGRKMMARNPRTRALLSTYVSLRVLESTLSLEIFSAEKGNNSIDAIPFIATLQEARRIIQSRGNDIVVSPASSMEAILRRWLEYLGNGKEYEQIDQFDVMKDLKRFYNQWKPAITEARQKIFPKPAS